MAIAIRGCKGKAKATDVNSSQLSEGSYFSTRKRVASTSASPSTIGSRTTLPVAGSRGPWKPGRPIRFGDGDAVSEAAPSAQIARTPVQRWQARQEIDLEKDRLEINLQAYSYKRPLGHSLAVAAKLSGTPQQSQRNAPSLRYTADLSEAEEVLACLGAGPLGFDMEWDISTRRGQPECPTAVVQICSASLIVVLHISVMKQIPLALQRILTDPGIIKCGVAIGNDAKKFARDFAIGIRNAVELSQLAKVAAPEEWAGRKHLISLRDLCRVHLQQKLLKGEVRTSTWSKPPLTKSQIEYGACDAYVGLELLSFFITTLQQRAISSEPAGVDCEKLYEAASATVQPLHPKVLRALQESALQNPFAAQKAAGKVNATVTISATRGNDRLVQQQINLSSRSVLSPSAAVDAAPSAFVPTYQQAFHLWHEKSLSVGAIGRYMRSDEYPLKDTTVVGYILRALDEMRDVSVTPKLQQRLKDAVSGPDLSFVRRKYKKLLRKLGLVGEADKVLEVIVVDDSSVNPKD
ncbi:ribonuclease H-like protein [Tilletiaria anomala UBC 951]|uniref:3'-5' exonuclease n=1 Tax=Tilletiaria anomala (strain ATCC 24038 / CBS 436.72 / UBC 951) TaxID=1037660 RepID=A0A066WS62_TILAU|nr:ribonuclease H-like protein [Tilletiaria anomala UBC 951]KDN53525.1 ribonuclease H-like protein [Tilletiaria anomala UBC 951]